MNIYWHEDTSRLLHKYSQIQVRKFGGTADEKCKTMAYFVIIWAIFTETVIGSNT